MRELPRDGDENVRAWQGSGEETEKERRKNGKVKASSGRGGKERRWQLGIRGLGEWRKGVEGEGICGGENMNSLERIRKGDEGV